MASAEEREARIAELEESVRVLREQLRRVARLLPIDALAELPAALEGPVEVPAAWSPTSGWVESVELCPADVIPELEALWRRVGGES